MKLILLFSILFFLALGLRADDDGVWKTAFAKRSMVGDMEGPNTIIRNPVPLAINGTKVRIYLQPRRTSEAQLTTMSLAKGADESGTIIAPPFPVTFAGQPSLQLAAKTDERPPVSDDIAIPVTAGMWYLQESFKRGTKVPYSYDVDGGFHAATDSDTGITEKIAGARSDIAWRVDVLTKDARPLIACYGDSVTQGYGATPSGGKRYPDLLGKELNQPVLNLGVNSDELKNNAGAFVFIKQLAGVNIVVFLMGVNDIMVGGVKTVNDYAALASAQINSLHGSGLKVIWGTIPPATGYKQFSDNPAKEALRVQINQWILANTKADGIADFSTALTDPKDPKLLNYAYQYDWLHPNDDGNIVMAKVAADAVRKVETPVTPPPAPGT